MSLTKLTAPSANLSTGGETITGTDATPTKRGASVIIETPYKIQHALRVIEENYGDTCLVKNKTLLKFGRSELVGTSNWATIMNLPTGVDNETYVSSNIIDTLSSADTGDTYALKVEGHTVDGSGNFTFVSQDATLDGQNKVVLTTPLARISRAYNNDSTDLTGPIYFYEDDTISAGVPTTNSKVHMIIPAGYNQTFKASTTFSNTDYYLVTGAYASVNEKTAATVTIRIQIKQKGKVFRTFAIGTVSTNGSSYSSVDFDPVLIVPKNADIRMQAISSASNTDVSGWFSGYLALVQS